MSYPSGINFPRETDPKRVINENSAKVVCSLQRTTDLPLANDVQTGVVWEASLFNGVSVLDQADFQSSDGITYTCKRSGTFEITADLNIVHDTGNRTETHWFWLSFTPLRTIARRTESGTFNGTSIVTIAQMNANDTFKVDVMLAPNNDGYLERGSDVIVRRLTQ